jgi:signal transduction histidine kinase
VRVRLLPTEGGVRVLVEDSGPGIEPELAARVGEPFLTGWPSGKGAGLGLYVARTFARAARGDLRLEPCEGRGTRAILELARDTLQEAP